MARPLFLLVPLFLLSLGLNVRADEKVREALRYQPKQKGVDYDQPAEAEIDQCTLESAKKIDRAGFIVRSPSQQILRLYVDTNGDRNLDRWSYFRDGVEVYADIDSDFDGKADEFHWYGPAGSRWGKDTNGDHQIDRWLSLSPEEASAEVVEALRERNADRFRTLLLTDDELKSLGFQDELQQEIRDKIQKASGEFAALAQSQTLVGEKTEWIQFGGIRPGVLADTVRGVTQNVTIYDNAAAVIATGSESGQVAIGTMIRVGDVWRVCELPQPVARGESIAVGGLFYRTAPAQALTEMAGGGENAEVIGEYVDLLKQIETAADGEQPALHEKLSQVILKIIDAETSPPDRAIWIKQYADMLSNAYQDQRYPDGLKRLQELSSKLEADGAEVDVQSYAIYRAISAKGSLELSQASDDKIGEIHQAHLERLKQFAEKHPQSEFVPDALYQLATNAEIAEPERAIEWYEQIVREFPKWEHVPRAQGALNRLQAKGKPLEIRGKTMQGVDFAISKLRGRAVIVHYWASWSGVHDIDELRRLYAKFKGDGLEIIGICVDDNAESTQTFLKENEMAWTQLSDGKGLDGPLAEQLGITMVPTMLLFDREGKVVENRVQVEDLDGLLRRMLKGEDVSQKPAEPARRR